MVQPSGELNKFGEPVSAPELTLKIQRAALERGLMIEKGGRDGSVLRFLPPVIISFEQIDFALKTLKEAIIAAGGGIDPTKEKANHQDWQQHFIQTGLHGADSFEKAMNQTTQAMKAVFEAVDKPYSGIEPQLLKAQIEAVILVLVTVICSM